MAGVPGSMYRIPSAVKTDSGKLITAAAAIKYHYNDWGILQQLQE